MYTTVSSVVLFFVCVLAAESVEGTGYVEPIRSRPSSIEEYPGLVSLHSTSNAVCAGSVIDEGHVLTTGRCARLLSGESTARSGSSLVTFGGKSHNIVNISVHPSYNPRNFDYDVAVIAVDARTPFSKSQITQLTKTNAKLSMYQPLSVYGWGDLERNSSFSVEVLPYMDRQECNRFFSGSFVSKKLVTERMFCVRIEPRFEKSSDLGSPAVTANKTQAGISSWHRGRPEDIYTVYTDLTNQEIADFVLSAVKSLHKI